jgi:hypothetical protein
VRKRISTQRPKTNSYGHPDPKDSVSPLAPAAGVIKDVRNVLPLAGRIPNQEQMLKCSVFEEAPMLVCLFLDRI